ncbi:MAG: acyltransferase [Opitutae bacterium]|nr:acyltransferase [Opitutae bacterium]
MNGCEKKLRANSGHARSRPAKPEPWGLAYRDFKATRFFGSLDGLRALSIVAVIWFHTVSHDHATLLGQGNKGVTLFFAISGFLIVTLLLRQKERTGSIDLGNFWARRVLRIFPVYYLALSLYVVLVALVERDPAAREAFWGNLPAFATFTSNWFVDLENARVIFYFAWSLAAEEQFYLLWPLVERVARGRRPLLIAGVALLVTQAVAFAWPLASRGYLPLRMVTSVPAAILFGVALAHLLHRPRTFHWLWTLFGRRGSAFGAAAVALAALAFAPAWGAAGELAMAFALALLVAACVVREDNDLARVLRLRPVAWIGTVSYGMYLFHMVAVNLVRRAASATGVTSPYVDFLGGTLLALALATASYLTYERFFLWLKERWFASERSALAAPVRKPVGTLTVGGALRPDVGREPSVGA